MTTTQSETRTSQAIIRLLQTMEHLAPSMTNRAELWMNGLSKNGVAADYFQHPLAFPMLLLPQWVEEAIHGTVNEDLQADLTYSSVSGYYFIRMIDNVMDEQGALEIQLLPMTGFFHAEATAIYHKYFAVDHLFWQYFSRWNAQSAALAIADSLSEHITLADFKQIAGKKVVGGKIPIAAVLAYHGRLDDLSAWEHFYDKLSCWHQMFNDVLSWYRDMQHGTTSYFLCEGSRRKQPDEAQLTWLLREGFSWGLGTLTDWLEELQYLATDLHSSHLTQYLNHRSALLREQATDLHQSATTMAQLLKLTG